MDRHFKRRQDAHCGSKKYAWYLRVDSMAWAMPMPDHLSYPAGRSHPFHNRGLTPPAISPSKDKEFRRCGVPLDCLEVVPTEIAGSGDDNARISTTSQGREDNSSSHDLVSGLKGSLDCVARVLALSATSEKRQLLCDRKEPFAHLTPRRLALTVIKSGIVTGAPLLNEAILESLDEEDRPSGSSNESRAGQGGDGLSGFMLNDSINRVFVDGRGNIVRTGQQELQEDGRDDDTDLMKTLAKSFKNFPVLVLRRVLHNVMSVSTQRILEWQAVVHLSTRSADRLTKNIALSALRKTKRMSRGTAAAKMFLTAGRALFFQNLAVFIVDELFVAVRLGFEERNRRKHNPYSSTDWEALLREMKEKTYGNAVFALSMWAAGTLGAMVGTLVYPKRGPDLLSTLAELGASALLN